MDGPSINALHYSVTSNTFSGLIQTTDQMNTSDGVSFTAIGDFFECNSTGIAMTLQSLIQWTLRIIIQDTSLLLGS